MTDANTRGHHPFSPSSLQARNVSPCWANRKDSASDASKAGTAQHDAAEGDFHLDDPALTDTQASAVAACKAYREKIKARYVRGCTLISEVYLPVDDEIMVDAAGNEWLGTTGGYLDCGMVGDVLQASGDWELEADILDWKFGMWSVEDAKTNLQGHAYLLGIFKKYPHLARATVHFLMPHRDELTTHAFERNEFPGLYLNITKTVRTAEALTKAGDLSKCNPTTASCMFCGNVGKCPLVAGIALAAGKKYAPIKIPESIDVTLIPDDPAQVKAGLELASIVAVWAKAYRAQVTEKVIANESFLPEGYKLVSKADREVVDEKLVIDTLIKFGVKRELIEACKTLPLTPIGKLIRDTAERGFKEAKEKEFTEATIENGSIVRGQPYSFLERLKS